jgi:hypothetical protein
MLLPQRFILLPLVGVLLGLLAGLYLAAYKRASKAAASGNIASHKVKTHPDDALKYWTEERMRNARPAPMPHISSSKQGKQPPDTSDKERL